MTRPAAPKVGAMAQTPHVIYFYDGTSKLSAGNPRPLPSGTFVTVVKVNKRDRRALVEEQVDKALRAWVDFEVLEVSR